MLSKFRSISLNWADKLLLFFGILGIALWIWQYPMQHLDGAVQYPKDLIQIEENAKAFLTEKGFKTLDYHFEVKYIKNRRLWYDVQQILGREQAVAVLKTDVQEQMPVYFWEVEACKISPQKTNRENPESYFAKCPFKLHLTPKGEIWTFINQFSENPTTVFLNNKQYFNFSQNLSHKTLEKALINQPSNVAENGISLQKAITSAKQHLYKLPFFQKVAFKADSISLLNGSATLKFSTDDSFFGVKRVVWVRLNAALALTNLEVKYIPLAPLSTHNIERWLDIISLGLFGISILVFMVVFFKRLQTNAIDLSTAVRDGAWGAFFTMSFLLLFMLNTLQKQVSWAEVLTTIGIVVLLGSVGGGFVIFLISGATDALARTFLPDKLIALNLVRRFHIRNQPVGLALLRGLMAAAMLLGLISLLLWLCKPANIYFSRGLGDAFPHTEFLQPYLGVGSLMVVYVFLFMWMIFLGFGSWLFKWKGKFLLILGCGIGYVLFSVHVLTLSSLFWDFLISFSIGTFLGVVYWRYDIFTAGIAHVVYSVTLYLAVGFTQPQMPESLDFALLIGTILLLGFFGLYAVFYGKTPDEVEMYIPKYISELAKEERMRRDLEIARDIQLSFLPQKMPQMEGLSIMAICETAQQVGGDYYDFIQLDEHRLAVIVGDVSGKGIPAALYMTLTKGFVQTLSRETDNPAEVLKRLNNLFCLNAKKGVFISAVYGILDLQAKIFTFARAGHNPIILKRTDREVAERFLPQGIAIGLINGKVFDDKIQNNTLHLRSGDVLLLYTDGLSEAMDKNRFQLTDKKVADLVAENAHKSVTEISQALLSYRRLFSEKEIPEDDCTLMVLKIDGFANSKLKI